MSTTNYHQTFISVAEDCRAVAGEVPPRKDGPPTVASLQHELLSAAPYTMTSDDLLFEVFARRNAVPDAERAEARATFFSRSQACLRASPLAKTYGWGIHHDADGRVAIYAMESPEYRALQVDAAVKQLRAVRSRRA